WVGTGAIRVAARMNGSASDRRNRLSDGRVDLVRLVGAGVDAPLRMAALRLLGNTVCRIRNPVCGECPLRAYCPARGEEGAEDLFGEVPDDSGTEETSGVSAAPVASSA